MLTIITSCMMGDMANVKDVGYISRISIEIARLVWKLSTIIISLFYIYEETTAVNVMVLLWSLVLSAIALFETLFVKLVIVGF